MITRKASARSRRRAAALVSVSAAVAIALTGCTSDATRLADVPTLPSNELPAETTAQVEAAVTAAMQAVGASGAIVGVWVPWSGSWVSGLGTVATGSETKVTADMSFRAGTITREMTCDALAGMVADDIVDYDDAVSDYIPGIRTEEPVTLEQLCDGNSGWASISPIVKSEFLTNPERVWHPRELASFGFGAPAIAAPGVQFTPSDAGYLLLGLALERASGHTAEEYFAEYVTGPLGLTNTQLPTDAAAAPEPTPHLVGQYVPSGSDGVLQCAAPVDISVLSSSSGYTDSGVTTTIEELGTYASALAAKTLLQAGEKDRFADPFPVVAGGPSWFNANGGSIIAGTLIGQGGSVPGYAASAFSDPETGMTIAVVLNSSSGDADVARNLALQLAAIASKAPATEGATAPDFGLPWTSETYGGSIASHAICPIG